LLLSIVAIVVTASLLGLGQNLNASCDSANKGFQSSGGGRADSGNPSGDNPSDGNPSGGSQGNGNNNGKDKEKKNKLGCFGEEIHTRFFITRGAGMAFVIFKIIATTADKDSSGFGRYGIIPKRATTVGWNRYLEPRGRKGRGWLLASLSMRNRRGQSIVEFALVVPMLLLLVFEIAEFGRAWLTKNILTGAAREAVRIAVVQVSLANADTAAGQRAGEVLHSANITTYGFLLSAPPGDNTAVVTTTYDYSVFILNFIPGLNHTFQLRSMTSMKKERLP